jgi:hypothetical protein
LFEPRVNGFNCQLFALERALKIFKILHIILGVTSPLEVDVELAFASHCSGNQQRFFLFASLIFSQ